MHRSLALALFLPIVGCNTPSPVAPYVVPPPAVMTLTARPAVVLLSGSEIHLTANVITETGGPSVGTMVRFSTTGASLSAATNQFGEAIVAFGASGPASFTAIVDGGPAQTISLPAVAPFTLDVAPTVRQDLYAPTEPWRGTVTVTPAAGVVNPPVPVRIVTTCGTLSPVTHGGPTTGASFTCMFPVGVHVVRATAETSSGWSTAATVSVPVETQPLIVQRIPIHYDVVISGQGETRVAFGVATLSDAYRHFWDFGDGSKETTGLPQVAHTYVTGHGGRERDVSVRIANRDGVTIATGSMIGFW